MKRKLFFDLDDTLMVSIERFSETDVDDSAVSIQVGVTTYNSFENQKMINFLHASRIYNNCYMLTAASELYAKAHNLILKLGFKDDEIFSKQYVAFKKLPFDIEKENTFLIDNLDINSSSSKEKMNFLGIEKENYIQVESYYGSPNCSDKDIEILVKKFFK